MAKLYSNCCSQRPLVLAFSNPKSLASQQLPNRVKMVSTMTATDGGTDANDVMANNANDVMANNATAPGRGIDTAALITVGYFYNAPLLQQLIEKICMESVRSNTWLELSRKRFGSSSFLGAITRCRFAHLDMWRTNAAISWADKLST